MKRSSRDSKLRVVGACALLTVAACVGTPTPEPPDFLPIDGSLVNMTPVNVPEVGPASTIPVVISGAPGAVQGGTDVWLVNLDNRVVADVYQRANADGSFRAEIAGEAGDRVRLVSRTPTEHSLPLDFEIILANAQLGLRRLGDTSLQCLKVVPLRELSVSSDESKSFEITNLCAQGVTLQMATLRFGDQGFSLAEVAESIAVRDTVEVSVAFGPGSGVEVADILLVDVMAGNDTGRYALGVWGQ